MPIVPARIDTARLVLQPVDRSLAEAIVAGDLSGLAAGEGWPHEDTLDGLRLAATHGAHAWLVTRNGTVIGDAGTHGEPDASGDVDLGYGLAAPSRGRGYGSELVAGLAQWLLGQDSVRRVVANGVLASNTPSRRALERAGFTVVAADDAHVSYALAGR